MLSLNDCLDLAVERCAIFFRKVEIRQTRGEELVLLLSSLEAMWQGRRKGSSASIKSSSSNGGTKRRGKRKSSPPASNSSVGSATCHAKMLLLFLLAWGTRQALSPVIICTTVMPAAIF